MEPILYKKSVKPDIKRLFYYFFIFFVSKAPFIGNTYPFGISVFLSDYDTSIPYITGIIIILSQAVTSPIYAIITLAGMIILSVVKRKSSISDTLLYIISGVSFFLISVIFKLFSGFCLYDIAVLSLSALTTVVFAYVMQKTKLSSHTPKLNSDDFISLCIIFTIFSIGIFNTGFTGKYFIFAVSSYICLSATYKNAISFGTVTGVILGVICGFPSYNFTFFIALYSLSALFSGIFIRYGKLCFSLAYITSSLVVTFYGTDINTAYTIIIIFIVSVFLFLITPDKYLLSIKDENQLLTRENNRMNFLLSHKIAECSDSIKELSLMYSDVTYKNSTENSNASSAFFDKATSRLCENCSNQYKCWIKSYAQTYSAFFVLHILCEKNGTISYSDIPEYLIRKCIKRNELIKTFVSSYNIYKLDKFWECRIAENRSCMHQQLRCISDAVVRTFRKTEDNFAFNANLEGKIRRSLFYNKIPFTNVIVSESDKVAIDLFVPESSNPKIDNIEEIISRILHKKCSAVKLSDTHFHIFPCPLYKMNISILQKGKNDTEDNGDSILCTQLKNGQYMIILSDGMGSGNDALYNSRFTVMLTEKLLNCDFTIKNSIDIINSALLSKSTETSFATIDLSLINLYDLSFSLYKLGASYSFIKRGETTKTIPCDTLPAGTFTKSDISKTIHTLTEGDALIMVSDGVVTLKNLSEIEYTISNYIGTDPDVLANKIYRICTRDSLRDDISIIVAFAEKNV